MEKNQQLLHYRICQLFFLPLLMSSWISLETLSKLTDGWMLMEPSAHNIQRLYLPTKNYWKVTLDSRSLFRSAGIILSWTRCQYQIVFYQWQLVLLNIQSYVVEAMIKTVKDRPEERQKLRNCLQHIKNIIVNVNM